MRAASNINSGNGSANSAPTSARVQSLRIRPGLAGERSGASARDMSSTINGRPSIDEPIDAVRHAINHAAKPPETSTVLWHCRTGCGTPGNQRVPDGTVEFIHARAQLWRREIVQARIRLANEGLSYNQ